MPLNKSAIKRDRQNLARRARNRVIKSRVHTAYIRLTEAMNLKDKEAIDSKLKIYVSNIDKAVKKGIFHINKGARIKSRIVKKIKNLFNESKAA